MADTITITCPECEKQLRVSSDTVGKKVRCKGCDEIFVIRAPGRSKKEAKPPAKAAPAKSAPAKKEAPKPAANSSAYDDIDNNPYGVTEEYLGRRCPDCAEPMEDDDIVCLECGYNTTTREKPRKRRIQEQTPGDIFIWLLPGIATALVILTIITLDVLYIAMVTVESLGGDEVWYSFVAGQFAKIYVSLFCIFLVYTFGRFAVKRLIFNPLPPEIEIRDDGEAA